MIGYQLKKSIIHWQYCKDLNDINNAIISGNEDWQGLKNADQIFSIVWDDNQMCYVVFWRVEQLFERTE